MSAGRWGPRLLILGGLTTLVVAVIGLPGASALPGPTDLSLTKNDSADPVVRGSNFTYTIQVRNPDPANDAENVTVVDPLPSQVGFVSATASSGTCQQTAGTVTCNLGTLLANTAASVTITVKAQRQGTATNVATVSTTTLGDPNAANNQDTETTSILNKGKAKKVKASCASPTISGTAGNDILTGTNRADVIRAFAGDDQVFAGDGRDLICADLGADLVSGGPKSDTVIGGGGPDRLIGNTGGDVLRGKSGRDRLRGNFGNDLLNGGRGRDSCKGGPGQDTLRRCP
ncbi:MAG: hypothetical protein ACRDK5_07315 [Solirubrobacterales bacterium]